MQVIDHQSLKAYNTFGIDAIAERFASFNSIEDLEALLLQYSNDPLLVLGGGSNLLLTGNVKGLVLKNNLAGIQKIKENDEFVYVKAGAGENWHGFVLYCIEQGWAGVENLSLIPGCVGASPMQNIGAYGVEIKDVFDELQAYHIREKKVYTFSKEECEFGYRESVFKRRLKNEFIILEVQFKLRKQPIFHTSYGAIEKELESMQVEELSIKGISDAVIRIRSSKLPDPKQIGNAGSFFKNPTVSKEQFDLLQQTYPDIVGYPVNDQVKLAAGWMIEKAGWKGFREGDAGVHQKQALVLVNYGKASGKEIYNLSERILQNIQQQFGVLLEREVNIIA